MLTEFVTAHADRFNAWLDTEAILAKAAREGANAPVPPRPHARNALFSALARSRIEAGHRLRHGYPLPLPAPAVEAATAQCAATRAAAEIMTEKACTKPFATWR
ncbi:hypothetical protein [Sodalis praecaptivus]|uniref:hypothetical protein n=1 Tax=Sodalis praecaptivus TaxID=1239307 RepID=UPI00280C1DC7|nr:hypothetical protein [Sodalis praecaptivus]